MPDGKFIYYNDTLYTSINNILQKYSNISQLIYGTYVGDGAEERIINIGTNIKIIILNWLGSVFNARSGNDTIPYGGIAMNEYNAQTDYKDSTQQVISIIDNGFKVYYTTYRSYSTYYYAWTNRSDYIYYYIAIA